eukprot:TRINITY_DN16527_c1_g1_i1.p1 TRINITY_DN16527_c1_g1~~TRINITY_DN16527_c1_g1_i1.p1  ORF type:complete len:333 (+),score=102.64 TRINITY_DN16527_c1_g1_i1:84-1001(+)
MLVALRGLWGGLCAAVSLGTGALRVATWLYPIGCSVHLCISEHGTADEGCRQKQMRHMALAWVLIFAMWTVDAFITLGTAWLLVEPVFVWWACSGGAATLFGQWIDNMDDWASRCDDHITACESLVCDTAAPALEQAPVWWGRIKRQGLELCEQNEFLRHLIRGHPRRRSPQAPPQGSAPAPAGGAAAGWTPAADWDHGDPRPGRHGGYARSPYTPDIATPQGAASPSFPAAPLGTAGVERTGSGSSLRGPGAERAGSGISSESLRQRSAASLLSSGSRTASWIGTQQQQQQQQGVSLSSQPVID